VPKQATGRRYDDPCGVARALDIIGERWALLVVRELLFGPKRFTDLLAGLPTISPNVLSQRLRDLQASEIVRRAQLGKPTPGVVYELTDRGQQLAPVLQAIARWGSRLPLDSTAALSTDALLLALQTTVDPAKATLGGTVRLRLDDRSVDLRAADGSITVLTEQASPEVTITTDPATLRAVVFGRLPATQAIEAGRLHVDGSQPRAKRFLSMFKVPAPFEQAG